MVNKNIGEIMDYGITETVKTIQSNIKINDIIYDIVEKKSNAIKYFLEGEEFNQAIIFGAYLCGNFIADLISKDCDEVILVDIYPHLKDIVLNENITFMEFPKFQLDLKYGKFNPDLLIDLTGIGGLSPEIISQLNPSVLIVENPTGTFDKEIYNIDNSKERLVKGNKRGLLNTFRTSKVSKTSGTMTLVIDTVIDSCNEIKELDGVLYAIPNLKYYEGMLFHEKNVEKYVRKTNLPAITVSCLDEDIEEEVNNIIKNNLNRICSYVEKVK